MYPARFEYFAPTTVEEAVSILERYGDEAKVLAGGQSLIPLMKLRFASPRALVDINRIAGLDEHYEDNDLLNVGALVRHKDCERSELLRKSYDVLADAAPQISDPVVRNLGTVAGSPPRCRRIRAGAGAGRDAHDSARRLVPGPVHHSARADRGRHLGAGPGAEGAVRGCLPQAGAQSR
jgi:CO/xanthine dehydrogenase FAD-binding subunit